LIAELELEYDKSIDKIHQTILKIEQQQKASA